ncbi:YqhR family membrane protein [Aquibacillus sp. 3ASR75-11]|uniref:YqhR family membrane protein n=1 Tax=Terrihalobacillus insolitus TaxID=2950438 RepID=A0A9X3WVF7_9BACI|nr:YqhR family membrane protein [Terrihalobacillus insolitus]MDC3414418.1 YqhR family membrane protein [Terrihalobacillus insolitus]MDC3425298.1 YqhR family membrane protein [Terrihalobacillus insolitus]
MEKEKLEQNQNQNEKPMSAFVKAIVTGVIGGLLWSFLGAVTHYFNFSSVSPATFLIRSWLQTKWSDGWLGELLAIIALGLISILIAILYYALLRKMKGIWPSIVFGVVLWFLVFYLLQPIFPNIKSMTKLTSDTVVTTVCLFILYGTFIGYSISYEYYDSIKQNEPKSKAET